MAGTSAAEAGSGRPVLLGRLNVARAVTTIRNRRDGGTGLRVRAHGRGSIGIKATGRAVAVDAAARGAGIAIRGFSEQGTGVSGRSFRQVGVDGLSGLGAGVQGQSEDSFGVLGISHWGSGVAGGSVSPDAPAVAGTAQGGATGVRGWSSSDPDAAEPTATNTGVHGVCHATDGTGVLAQSAHGAALRVHGRAVFSRSGVLRIPAGAESATRADVSLSRASLVFAVLREHQPGLHVEAVVPDAAAGSFAVYLSGTADVELPVCWFVVN